MCSQGSKASNSTLNGHPSKWTTFIRSCWCRNGTNAIFFNCLIYIFTWRVLETFWFSLGRAAPAALLLSYPSRLSPGWKESGRNTHLDALESVELIEIDQMRKQIHSSGKGVGKKKNNMCLLRCLLDFKIKLASFGWPSHLQSKLFYDRYTKTRWLEQFCVALLKVVNNASSRFGEWALACPSRRRLKRWTSGGYVTKSKNDFPILLFYRCEFTPQIALFLQIITYAAIPVCIGASLSALSSGFFYFHHLLTSHRQSFFLNIAGKAFYDLSNAHPHDAKMPAYPYLHIRSKDFPWGPNGLFESEHHHEWFID